MLSNAGIPGEEEASASAKSADQAAPAISWSCCANLSSDSQLSVQDSKGQSLLSCIFKEARVVSHSSDFYDSVVGKPRPPPERWRAALEVGGASILLNPHGTYGSADLPALEISKAAQVHTGAWGATNLSADAQNKGLQGQCISSACQCKIHCKAESFKCVSLKLLCPI